MLMTPPGRLGPARRDSDSIGLAVDRASGLFLPASQRQLRDSFWPPSTAAVFTVPRPSLCRDAASRVPEAPAAGTPSPGPSGAEVLTLGCLSASDPSYYLKENSGSELLRGHGPVLELMKAMGPFSRTHGGRLC